MYRPSVLLLLFVFEDPFHPIVARCTKQASQMTSYLITLNSLINSRGVHLILGVQAKVFNRQEALKEREAFILLNSTSSTNLRYAFGEKIKSVSRSGISTPSIDTSRDPYLSFNPNTDVRILAIVLPSLVPALVYPYYELNIEQDEIHKALKIKQETEFPIYIHD